MTRGDRNRNRKIAVLRQVVRRDRAVLAVDLGEDKQAAVLVDHEGRVQARKTVTAKAHRLGALLEWAAGQAARAGFAGLVVACEPTGHRWKALMGLADAAGAGFVCVQPLAVHREREKDDYTRDKTDHRDAYLIGRLAVRLDCYLPERAEEAWARLRHLGARRSALVADVVCCTQQVSDLLACAWPAALATAARPLESTTWLAAMGVVTDRCCGDPARLRTMGYEKFLAAVRRELPRWGAKRVYHKIVTGLWDALADRGGVAAQRRGALERVHLVMADWRSLLARQADTEGRMCAVLDELGLTGLVTSIDGLSAVGAAVILAETGELSRFATSRAVVKHAGLNPAENTSATLAGRTRISRRGRPGLRTAAWRAAWPGLRHNRVLAARYAHLTGRDSGTRLSDGQARAACAAALLRWLWAVVTRRQAWDARIAAGLIPARAVTAPAAA
ncbi:MAG TPA: IS110 family transposase [Streptosporangiaceae bacterium]|nr:IS110 family transposase [Streptosporangiaceae bacterium]HTQ90285.1 IS110 family transposase [Streptosporangiaceae bacterium]